jgi:hypothetical protein
MQLQAIVMQISGKWEDEIRTPSHQLRTHSGPRSNPVFFGLTFRAHPTHPLSRLAVVFVRYENPKNLQYAINVLHCERSSLLAIPLPGKG